LLPDADFAIIMRGSDFNFVINLVEEPVFKEMVGWHRTQPDPSFVFEVPFHLKGRKSIH
jgi:hypothetical protein